MTEKKEENLIEYLETLRSMLIRCLLALTLGILPMFLLSPYVMETLIDIVLKGNNIQFNFFSPIEVFILQLKIALILDILVCFPYIAKQLWNFVLPALYEHERNFIKSLVLSSSVLFITGVLFCLFFIMPLIVRFGLSFVTDNIKAMFGIGNIMSLLLWLSFIFGIMFQFSLVTYALLRFRLTAYDNIKNKRSYVFIGILVFSGLLTPPDIISQLLLTIPTYVLFEIGLFFGKKYSLPLENK